MPMEGTQIYQDVAKDQSINDAVGKPQMHLSGDKHTTGEAVYCDDVQVADALHASFVISQKSMQN
jgi:xanthine dehydrogenase molybdopterin-binding subunit B